MALCIITAQQDNDLMLRVAVKDALGHEHHLTIDGEQLVCEDHAAAREIMQILGARVVGCGVWAERWQEFVQHHSRSKYSQFRGTQWKRLQEIAQARGSLQRLQESPVDDPLAAALGGTSTGGLDLLPLTFTETQSDVGNLIKNKFDSRCGKKCKDGSRCQRVLLPGSKCPLHA